MINQMVEKAVWPWRRRSSFEWASYAERWREDCNRPRLLHARQEQVTTYLTTYPWGSRELRRGQPSYAIAQIGFLQGFMEVPGGLKIPT
jgi:hypothetical protein